MKIQLASIQALSGIVALLCLRPAAAYDDADFVREWKDWNNRGNDAGTGKTRNLVSSRRNVFKVPKDNGDAEKKQGVDGVNMFVDAGEASTAAAGDVTPFIVGGTVVNPPRKYKVSSRMWIAFFCLLLLPMMLISTSIPQFFVWFNGCGGALVHPKVVSPTVISRQQCFTCRSTYYALLSTDNSQTSSIGQCMNIGRQCSALRKSFDLRHSRNA